MPHPPMVIIKVWLLLTMSAAAIAVGSMASAQQYTLSTLAAFNGTNGSFPVAGLIADASGNLNGTTYSGGASGDGSVFEVANDANHTLTTLATFNGTNGSFPAAGLIADASGNLYGTTFRGGLKGDGTVLEVANNANHTLSTLVMFSGANGANPRARLIADASGNLYGTTYGGGANGTGTVFECVPAGSSILAMLA